MNLIIKGIIRGSIPFIIMSAIALMLTYSNQEPETARDTFIAGLIFTSVAATTVVYDYDKWSLKKKSAVHFLLMLVTVFPCLIVSGWFPLHNWIDYLLLLGIFLG